jgi:hypothetical protein
VEQKAGIEQWFWLLICFVLLVWKDVDLLKDHMAVKTKEKVGGRHLSPSPCNKRIASNADVVDVCAL